MRVEYAPDIREAEYLLLYIVWINKYVLCATQALPGPAWLCHVALHATSHPRGTRTIISPFLLFFYSF